MKSRSPKKSSGLRQNAVFTGKELLRAAAGKLCHGPLNIQVQGISTDSRTIRQKEAFIALKGENFDGHAFIPVVCKQGASCIICESLPRTYRSSKATFIKVNNTLKALGDIAAFHRRRFDIPVIAVTGSNGKTTTKEMIAQVLSKKYRVLKSEGTKNNQVGVPLTLLGMRQAHEALVLEIGTNHFGEVEYLAKIVQPTVGVITNIGHSHLKYLKDLEGVFQEKVALLKNLMQPAIAVLNMDDVFLSRLAAEKTRQIFTIGIGAKAKGDFFASQVKSKKNTLNFLVNGRRAQKIALSTCAFHNIYNALAAVALGRLFGLGYAQINKQLASFIFPKSRFNLVTLNRINFIDDTYNSNPLSLAQALDALSNLKTKGRKILVMGDMLELGDLEDFFHHQAGCHAAKTCDALITVGRLSRLAATSARESGFDQRYIFTCDSSAQARRLLFDKLCPGKEDIILVKGSRLMKMEEVLE